jgi:poly(A) polymerase
VEIVQTLEKAGFVAFFAGGWVRDHVLGKDCQDIDIATSAHPEDVMALFPKSIAVGAQFGVVRVRNGGHEFEVATFRCDDQYVDGRRPKSVRFSSPEEDASRRDFTINGMFYDPLKNEIYDYVGGRKDLEAKIIRAIGEPIQRFQEDRLRIIRTIRFKNTLGFQIEPKTWAALCQEACHVVEAVSPERIWQELQKMFEKKVLGSCLQDFQDAGLLHFVFPLVDTLSKKELSSRIRAIQKYQGNVVVAICLLLQEEAALQEFADAYRLSRNERRIISTYLHVRQFYMKKRHTKEAYVRMYALPEAMECCAAEALYKGFKNTFMSSHRRREAELSFWTKQLKEKKFVVTGEDARALGVPQGIETGKFIEKAFLLSIRHGIKDKQQLLQRLQHGSNSED